MSHDHELDAGPDPAEVHTLAELAAALDALRLARGLSYRELDKAAGPDRLPASTLSDLLGGRRRPTEETLEVFLRACGVPRQRLAAWRAARERSASAQPPVAGAIRVAQAHPRRLGVHAAIAVEGAAAPLPVYVERDTDTAPGGVRALLRQAMAEGGLVVLVGSSSVGKTRCAFEAVRALMPQWWLIHPADAEQIRQIAAAAPARLVVWLDELQRFLGGPSGLTAATVRTLLDAGTVLIATIWSDRYAAYTTQPHSQGTDAYAFERELLSLGEVVHLSASLSAEEQDRAHAAAAGDRRIALALESAGYGLTQVIAAAPQLVDRWNNADPYARAVLTAAIDATRLHVRSALPARFLQEAAPGYCTSTERAQAPAEWFERALAYATRLLLGATAPLIPVGSDMTMGATAGYQLADYLLQHTQPERSPHSPPGTFWDACITHLTDPKDLAILGHQAADRMRYCYAIPLLRHCDHRDWDAARRLAFLLVDQGDIDEALQMLRTLAGSGDPIAELQLSGLQSNIEAYRALADTDSPSPAMESHMLRGLEGSRKLREYAISGKLSIKQVADIVSQFGDIDDLRHRVKSGDVNAAVRLVALLAWRREFAEMIPILHSLVDGGVPTADDQLIAALVELGKSKEAFRLARFGLTADGNIASLPNRGSPNL